MTTINLPMPSIRTETTPTHTGRTLLLLLEELRRKREAATEQPPAQTPEADR